MLLANDSSHIHVMLPNKNGSNSVVHVGTVWLAIDVRWKLVIIDAVNILLSS